AETGINVAVTEGLFKNGKGGLASAVNRCEIANIPVVSQRDRGVADLVVLRGQQMSTTQDQVYWFIQRSLGDLNNPLDCWMTAPDYEHNPVRRIDRQRNFLDLEIDAPGPIQQDEIEARRYFGRLRNPREIRVGPGTAKTERFRGPTVEISHIRGECL